MNWLIVAIGSHPKLSRVQPRYLGPMNKELMPLGNTTTLSIDCETTGHIRRGKFRGLYRSLSTSIEFINPLAKYR
jgi:hypothetical protein